MIFWSARSFSSGLTTGLDPVARRRHVDGREHRRLFVRVLVDLDRLGLERELQFTDLDHAAALEHDRLGEPQAVDEGPPRAAQVLDHVIALSPDDRRMPPRDRLGLENQVAVGVPTDDHHVAIDLVEPPRMGPGENLKRRDDALLGFHGGLSTGLTVRIPTQLKRSGSQRTAGHRNIKS